MIKAALEAEGRTDWPVTALGNPSFTEKWLKHTIIGQKIIAIRQASNLINSFVKPMATEHVFNGRVHANLNQLKGDDSGTISGRFSCDSPNLQQVPKRNKELAKPFRRIFVADPGHIFWERDGSQLEPRLFAHYSQDPNLLAGYNSRPFVDAHQTTATLLGVERDPTAKRMNMGIFTGMGIDALLEHLEQARATLVPRRQQGQFRLAVDRSFTLAGIGTVVTGTAVAGRVGVGDRLKLSPRGLDVRVRGIHAQNRQAGAGHAGQRLALNLAGVDKADVRGNELWWKTTSGIEAKAKELGLEWDALNGESFVSFTERVKNASKDRKVVPMAS
jgi:hypothetical protein